MLSLQFQFFFVFEQRLCNQWVLLLIIIIEEIVQFHAENRLWDVQANITEDLLRSNFPLSTLLNL